MATVSQGASQDVALGPDEAYRVVASADGDAYVDLLSGAPGSPYASPRLRGPTATKIFGPYGTAVRMRIRAISGNVTYNRYKRSEAFVEEVDGVASLVSPDGNRLPALVGPTYALYGDSLAEQGWNYLTPPSTNQLQSFTAAFWIKGTERDCPAGDGTLAYNATTRTLTWAASGEAAGAPTDASRTGMIYVPSSLAGHGIYLNWFGGSRTYTTGSITVTARAIGFNLYDNRTNGVASVALAFAQQCVRIAAYPDAQNGYEAIYGLGGGTTQELLDAEWQWSQITSGIADVIVGQNDAPAGMTAAQSIAALQTLLPRIKASLVRVYTRPPRNADTTAQKQQKQQVNSWIQQFCAGSARYVVFDMAAYLTDPATGNFVAAYSTDNVHPAGRGCIAAGKPSGQQLLTLAGGVRTPLRQSYNGQYDATNNPYGNSFGTAGMGTFEGSGGTAGTGASGVVPTGWRVQRSTGAAMTAVGSKVAYADKPGSAYRLTLANAAASEVITLDTVGTLSIGLAPGIKIGGYVSLNVVSSTSLESITLSAYDNGSTTQIRGLYNGSGVTGDFTGTLVIKLPEFVLPANAGAQTFRLQIGTGSGGAAVIDINDIFFGPVR